MPGGLGSVAPPFVDVAVTVDPEPILSKSSPLSWIICRVGVIVRTNERLAPGARLPAPQVTTPLLRLHPALAESNAAPLGSWSLITTPVAVTVADVLVTWSP